MSKFSCFLDPQPLAINRARQEHLDSLGLDLNNKTVIEVGAGIGLHTAFFLEKNCTVTITDGSPENVSEIKSRHPTLTSLVLDLEEEKSLEYLGKFDIVYCYGLLYHVGNPDSVLRRLSEICQEKLLLELICNPSTEDTITYVQDPGGLNQSTVGKGCRPSRRWILRHLNQYFGYGYISSTQPDYPDFPLDWSVNTHRPTRAIFVGSKTPLYNPLLLTEPLEQQQKYIKSS